AARPAPGVNTVVLTATVRELHENGVLPVVELFGHNQAPLPADVIVNGNGTYTVQAEGARVGDDYYARVRAAPGGRTVGTSTLAVHFGRSAAALETFAESALTAERPAEAGALYVATSQLFQFVLSAAPGNPAGAGVRMTVFNEAGEEGFGLAARPGEPVTRDGGAGRDWQAGGRVSYAGALFRLLHRRVCGRGRPASGRLPDPRPGHLGPDRPGAGRPDAGADVRHGPAGGLPVSGGHPFAQPVPVGDLPGPVEVCRHRRTRLDSAVSTMRQ